MFIIGSLLIGLAIVVIAGLLFVAALSRHHKQSIEDLHLIGARAEIATPLDPEGSVMVNGELWPARSRTGQYISHGTVVIAAAHGHLLHVDQIN